MSMFGPWRLALSSDLTTIRARGRATLSVMSPLAFREGDRPYAGIVALPSKKAMIALRSSGETVRW